MSEFIDGHRWPTSEPGVAPPEAVSLSDGTAPSAPAAPDSDQQAQSGALPDSLTGLLHIPDVWVQADEARCAVVIAMPSHVARALAPYATDPLQVLLAAQLVEAAELDAAAHRDELTEEAL